MSSAYDQQQKQQQQQHQAKDLRLEAQASDLRAKDKHIADVEARNLELRQRVSELERDLQQQLQQQKQQQPASSRMEKAQEAIKLSRFTPGLQEVSSLSVTLAKERQRIAELTSQHNDLLSLLAQVDLESSVYRAAIGVDNIASVDEKVKEECRARGWKYVNYR